MTLPALSDLTLQAIRKAVTLETEARLRTGKVQTDSLLAGNVKSKAVNAAEAECLNSELGLFEARTVTEKKVQVAYVRVAPKGIARLLEATPVDKYAELLKSAAAEHQSAIQAALASAVEAQLKALDQERAGIAERETALLEQFRSVVESRRNALQAEVSGIESRKKYFTEMLKAKPIPDETDREGNDSGPKPPVDRPVPKNEVEADYQRRMCEELAAEYNKSPASRTAIEGVFYITGGMDTFDEVGKMVNFDGRYHHGAGHLQKGDSCRVQKVGWVYRAPTGEENVLVRAEVRPI